MKKNFFSVIFFILILFYTSISFSNQSVAFIDLNYVLNNSVAGKKINLRIKEKSSKINTEFSDFQKKIDAKKEKLLAQKNVLSKEEYQKKFQELQKQVNEYNIVINKKNKDLSDFTNKAKSEFSKKLKIILEEYSRENSISMIFRKENLLIGKNDLDVTKGILDLLNKKFKEIKIK